MVKYATNYKKWKFVDERWLEFAMEPRNLWLGLATNGVNLFNEKQFTWSTWLVLLFNYNIPPWHEKNFIMLSLVIPRPDSVTNVNIDTYFEPLVEELKSCGKMECMYMMQVMCMKNTILCYEPSYCGQFMICQHTRPFQGWQPKCIEGAPFVLHTQYLTCLRHYKIMCTHANKGNGWSKIMSFVGTWHHLMGFKKWASLHQKW
jgi:hypothetical protein